MSALTQADNDELDAQLLAMTNIIDGLSLVISRQQAVMRQALEALLSTNQNNPRTGSAISALRTALAEYEPIKLEDIEQYRLQMAGISTAAIGYWKEGDSIHPDHDTPALRDVAKLYAKYHELYCAEKGQPAEQEPDGLPLVVAGAVFDFAGYITTRSKVIEVGSTANAGPVADLVKEWAKLRGLSLDDAAVLSWQEWLPTAPQPAKRVSLTREHVRASGGIVHSDGNVFFTSLEHLNSAVEAAHGINVPQAQGEQE